MNIITCLPQTANFHLFTECILSCYPESLWKVKQAESLPTSHLKQCFVVILEDKTVARAAIYYNEDLHYNMYKTYFIGAFESIANESVTALLIEYIEAFCKENGANFLIGPINGSTWEHYRLNTDNQSAPFLTEQIQQDYYPMIFENWGMKEVASYFSSFTLDIHHTVPQFEALDSYFKQNGATIRNIQLAHYEEELERLHPFLLDAFQRNFLYTPISKAAFIAKYKEYKNYLKEDYVLIAEDEHQQIIGIFFCIEDLLNPQDHSLIIKTIARNPEKKWRGLGHWMAQSLYNTAYKNGIQKIIHAFMKEEGTSTDISNNFLGTPFKKYKLYGKSL